MSSSMQPVNLSMSNLNIDNAARVSPNAYSSVQETGQSQEIIQEGIRSVQTVQANEKAAAMQRIHRKNAGDEQENHENSGRDTYEHTEQKQKAGEKLAAPIQMPVKQAKKGLDFMA